MKLNTGMIDVWMCWRVGEFSEALGLVHPFTDGRNCLICNFPIDAFGCGIQKVREPARSLVRQEG